MSNAAMNVFQNNFLNATSPQQLGLFREWLADVKDHPLYTMSGKPVWMLLCERQSWDCLEELLHVPQPHKIAINAKDGQGRGWLHYAIYHAMPHALAIEGMKLLDEHWGAPDEFGNTPLHALPHPKIGQVMAARYWREHPTSKSKNFFSSLQKQARQAQRLDLERIWNFWMSQ